MGSARRAAWKTSCEMPPANAADSIATTVRALSPASRTSATSSSCGMFQPASMLSIGRVLGIAAGAPEVGGGVFENAAIGRQKLAGKFVERFVGIEREPRWFDLACRRIEQAYAQPDLFVAPPSPKPEQLSLLPSTP